MQSQSDIRSSITNRIVAALRVGKIPWRKPWSDIPDPNRFPTNFTTKKTYTGINVPLLWLTQHEKGYPISYWASFDQWKIAGANVMKGEKGTGIVFFRQGKKKVDQGDGTWKVDMFPILRTWAVFNVAQVKGTVAEQFKAKPQHDGVHVFEDVDRTEFDALVTACGADIKYGFDKAAYYRLPADFIVMPDQKVFGHFGGFAETLLHELGHWTEHRLGWTGTYAEGELRAEIASSFLSAALNIPNSGELANHAAYIQSWLQALENDPKHIFKASSSASKAADFLLTFLHPAEDTDLEERESATV